MSGWGDVLADFIGGLYWIIGGLIAVIVILVVTLVLVVT
jgi:hypothetical protein